MSSPNQPSPLIEVRDLRVRFELESGPFEVIDNVSFTLNREEVLCVVGESGSGKTVMMHTLLGLVDTKPGVVQGHIITHFGGETVDLLEGLDRYVKVGQREGRPYYEKKAGWNRLYAQRTTRMLGRNLGLIFQNPKNALDPLMTVGHQIMESVRTVDPALAREALREQAISWLKRVQINHAERVFSLYPHQLSGGMCQRVAIAQILALRPEVLIADEPTTGLDATIQASILDLIKDVQREFKLSVMLITHDFSVVEKLADRVLVLFRGRLLELGEADNILLPRARLHPYTATLLRNVRVLEGSGSAEQIEAVGREAQRPRLSRASAAKGCNYVTLCPLIHAAGDAVSAQCEAEVPELKSIGPHHHVRCHLAHDLKPEAV
ncbi:MAG: ABC transporter ATP-binding protein [Myxococcota bacterium]